ncbi:hypothetical protein K523DRAFT_358587 [Schizophyllum commune Tattone D]|nr:hypothetical protein K523DRAFT_358587 [Schizophyllum commune Tattone D]
MRARRFCLGPITRPRTFLMAVFSRYAPTCVPSAFRIAFVAVLRAAGDAYRATETCPWCAASESSRDPLD